MYAYCNNTPVNLYDPTGTRPAHTKEIAMVAFDGGSGVIKKAWYAGIVEIVEEAHDYVFNDDEQKVLDAKGFAFYKGVPVVKVPFMGNDVASFGAIIMGSEANTRPQAIADVQHEYGHSVHFSQIGVVKYTLTVAIPSVTGYLFNVENYYSQPWEYIAEVLGGVNRMDGNEPYSYSSSASGLGVLYWVFTVMIP